MKPFVKKVLCGLLLALMLPAAAWAASPEELGLGLVDVGALDPSIVQDIKYATMDNFTGQVLYPSARCLLREQVAARLVKVQGQLKTQGLGLKVFDCYRPVSVQKKMWAVYPDENFVANPAFGSRHNRGASVDVGLVDSTGRELSMPSAFDEFSPKAHLDYMAASSEQLEHRRILQSAMKEAGFLPMATEWWHFDDPRWQNYGLTDADVRLAPSGAAQVLAVSLPRPGTASAELWGMEKTPQGWQTILGPVAVTVGRNGIAGFDQKREGDGMTPRGVFTLGPVFGYAGSAGTKMPYRQATAEDAWVDDVASPRYNQWVKGIPANESHEKMRRNDDLYRLGIVVGYNTSPVVPGLGSAIFLHIWRGPEQSTAGCVAMAAADMERIVSWLDPAKRPRIVIGYQGE